ncbi:MAG: pyrroline-5-carboxylate reductase family protein [Peptococcales bacterium]
MKNYPKILIIGSGRMGSFLAKKLSGFFQVYVYDKNYQKAEALAQASGAQALKKSELAVAQLVILALASESIPQAIVELESFLSPDAVLVNIATTFPHSNLSTKLRKVSAKIVGHAKEMALGETPVIIMEGNESDAREMVRHVFGKIGTVTDGQTDLVSKINTISSRQGIIAALEIKKALAKLEIKDEAITQAAIRIVAAGTMKAYAVGEAGPFVQAIIKEVGGVREINHGPFGHKDK